MFTQDNRTESFLSHTAGVQYQYEDSILISELWPNREFANLGRAEAINVDAVDEYAIRMLDKEAAPAVIVIKKSDGYHILDGVQRISAAKHCDATRFSAYVVGPRTSQSKQQCIRIAANARINGQHTPKQEETLETGVRALYFDFGLSANEVAQWLARKLEDVSKEIRVQATSRNAKKAGYDGPLLRRKGMLCEIGKHCDASDWQQAPKQVVALLNTFDEAKITNGVAKPAIEEFFNINRSKKKDRETQFASKLRNVRTDPDMALRLQGRAKRRATHFDKVLKQLKGAGTSLANCKKDKYYLSSKEAEAVAEYLRELYQIAKYITPHAVQFPKEGAASIYAK